MNSNISENPLNINPEQMFTADEISKIVNVSIQTISRDIRIGKLPAFKVGGKMYRIAGSDFIAYLNSIRVVVVKKDV